MSTRILTTNVEPLSNGHNHGGWGTSNNPSMFRQADPQIFNDKFPGFTAKIRAN